MVGLLLASTRMRQADQCAAVEVRISSAAAVFHFSKQDILRKLSGNHPELLVGAPVRTFDLRQLEQLLEQDLWVRNAELYFDHNKTLHVLIEERRPVARVFTDAGTTFYVDDMGMQLPISQQAAHVPVFTSFPAVGKKKVDSLLLSQVRDMGLFLTANELWQAQIDQVQLHGAEMELTPKLGMHTIFFGTATDISKKFKRLELFYDQVVRKVGWNFYRSIDLRFNRQLVATRRDSASLFASYVLSHDVLLVKSRTDSLAAVAADAVTDATPAVVAPATVKPDALPASKVSEPPAVPAPEKPQPVKQQLQVSNPNKSKTNTNTTTLPLKKPVAKPEEQIIKEALQTPQPETNSRQPKAVMPKRNTQQL